MEETTKQTYTLNNPNELLVGSAAAQAANNLWRRVGLLWTLRYIWVKSEIRKPVLRRSDGLASIMFSDAETGLSITNQTTDLDIALFDRDMLEKEPLASARVNGFADNLHLLRSTIEELISRGSTQRAPRVPVTSSHTQHWIVKRMPVRLDIDENNNIAAATILVPRNDNGGKWVQHGAPKLPTEQLTEIAAGDWPAVTVLD